MANKYGWEKQLTEDGVLYIREYELGVFRFIEHTIDEEENEVMFYTSEFSLTTYVDVNILFKSPADRMQCAKLIVEQEGVGHFTDGVSLGTPHAHTFDKLISKLEGFGI